MKNAATTVESGSIAAKRYYITLPTGKKVRLKEYVKAWRTLLAAPPEREFTGFEWYALSAREILQRFRSGLMDRINRHDPHYRWNSLSETRLFKKLDRAVKRGAIVFSCRWCGTRIEAKRYLQPFRRFCDTGCRSSYHY